MAFSSSMYGLRWKKVKHGWHPVKQWVRGSATENNIQSAGNFASVQGCFAFGIGHKPLLVLFTNMAFSVTFWAYSAEWSLMSGYS
jgi:hypothetical protein